MTNAEIIYIAIVGYILVMNVVAFFLYKRDKQNAQDKQERISEHWLLTVTWLGGALGAWIAMRRFCHKTHHWRFRLGIPLAFFVWLIPLTSITLTFVMRSGSVVTTYFMISRTCHSWADDVTYSQEYQWVDYEAISPAMTKAAIAADNGKNSITKLTARTVFTSGKKNILCRIRTAWYSFWMESLWGKKRIMEVYLNVSEIGDGVWGTQAASVCYFHHTAKDLTDEEAALIVACMPSPRKYNILNPSVYIRRRQQDIIKAMSNLAPINFE